jgi:two-component system, chemotaxis family, protein-glutamate methylesterase/glutaminase
VIFSEVRASYACTLMETNLFRLKTLGTNYSQIRVLVVDDSAFMRKTLSAMLRKCPDVQVVGTAQNGKEAIEQLRRCHPDVMTLDIDMPDMNGLHVLDYVMAAHPIPVIMISALTKEGAGATLQALERGAVDFIPKEAAHDFSDLDRMGKQLHAKVRGAYHARLGVRRTRYAVSPPMSSSPVTQRRGRKEAVVSRSWPGASLGGIHGSVTMPTPGLFPVVVIGSSTGGPNLLKELVRDISVPFPAAILIIQHMPKFFTKVFSENLNAISHFPIREAHHGDYLEPGIGFVAPGDQHLFLGRRNDNRTTIEISSEPGQLTYRPSVDWAMSSAAENFGPFVVGVVVSGMGNDGVMGCQKIKEYGGTVLVQDETTALMYGMPRAVAEAGWADVVVPDTQLAGCLRQIVEAM